MISVDVVDMAKDATTNQISPENKVEKQIQEPTPQQAKPQPQPTPKPPKPPAPPREAIDTTIPKVAAVDSTTPEFTAPDVSLKRPLEPLPTLPSVDAKVADIAPPAKVELKRPQPKAPSAEFRLRAEESGQAEAARHPASDAEPTDPEGRDQAGDRARWRNCRTS